MRPYRFHAKHVSLWHMTIKITVECNNVLASYPALLTPVFVTCSTNVRYCKRQTLPLCQLVRNQTIVVPKYDPQSQRQLRDSPGAPKSGGIEKRLLAIPLLFILLRMWGTLQFFYSLAVSEQNHGGCIPSSVRSTFMVIGILQVSSKCPVLVTMQL